MVNKYTRTLIDAVANEAEVCSDLLLLHCSPPFHSLSFAEPSQKAAKDMMEHKGKLVLMDVWPFLPSIFDKSTPAAWPHQKGKAFGPLLAYFLWEEKSEDQFWLGRMQTALDNVHQVALKEGCTPENAPVYLNCALEYTPVEEIYRGELKGLSAIRAKYDPTDVMGRTGGFKIPLPNAGQWSHPSALSSYLYSSVLVPSSSITVKRLKVEGFYTYAVIVTSAIFV